MKDELCWYCGSAAEHWEHPYPNNKNLKIPSCGRCNLNKAAQGIKCGPPGGYNWDVKEFHAVVAWRLGISKEDFLFYGQQVRRKEKQFDAPVPVPFEIPLPSKNEMFSKSSRCPDLPQERGGYEPAEDY